MRSWISWQPSRRDASGTDSVESMDPAAGMIIGFSIGLLCSGGVSIWISRMAKTILKAQRELGIAELEKKQQSIDMMVKSITEYLSKVGRGYNPHLMPTTRRTWSRNSGSAS